MRLRTLPAVTAAGLVSPLARLVFSAGPVRRRTADLDGVVYRNSFVQKGR